MIFGGLEIVAGGYLIHRHYRKKNEQGRMQQEVEQRRHHTFPGPGCPAKQNGWHTQAQHRPQHHQHQQHAQHQHHQPQYQQQQCQQQPAPAPQYKHTHTIPALTSPPSWSHHQQQPSQAYRPTHTPHTSSSSFTIPRRPVPERKPQIIIPSAALQRADSCATLSRMPIANGSRPHDVPEHASPFTNTNQDQNQNHHQNQTCTSGLVPASVPQHGIYTNAGFSVSSPAFGATATSPPLTYSVLGTHGSVDGWEVYRDGNRVSGYAPTVSTQLGEREAPPPYTP